MNRPVFKRVAFRSGILLLVGKVVSQLCSFIRNIIIARMIGVENFGIASTFSITISIIEMLGSMSLDKLLIQAKDGDDIQLQNTAHTIQAVRGIFAGFLLLLLAKPMAFLFGVENATWAFLYLAIVPVIRGFTHLDPQRVQRQMQYGNAIWVDIITQLLPTLFAFPLTLWLRDYSAMLWLLILQTLFGTLASFYFSVRPYRFSWNTVFAKRFFNFGWPLIINSILLFGIYQGDRFLIGTSNRIFGTINYTLDDLGVYAVATQITMTPMMALGSICVSLMLPILSRAQGDKITFTYKYNICSAVVAMIAGLFAIPLIFLGDFLIVSIYGTSYAAAGTFIGWLAAAQAIRMARFAPAMAAMANADTSNGMYSNLIRFSTLSLTAVVVGLGGALSWIAFAGFLGEFFSLLFSLLKAQRDHNLDVKTGLYGLVPLIVFMSLSGLSYYMMRTPDILFTILLCLSFSVAFMISLFYLFPSICDLLGIRIASFNAIKVSNHRIR